MKTMDEMIKADDQAICDNIDDLVFKYREKGIKIEYYLYNDNKLVYKG